ncbi:MAG: tetratricopeptide repeat protein [Rhizomicrobium sp.]|jgi:tetratricopeptide (TPR) repeat protein
MSRIGYFAIGVLLASFTVGTAHAQALGGAPVQSQFTDTNYTGADAGFVVISIALHDAGVGISALTLDVESIDENVLSTLSMWRPSIFGSKKYDIQDGTEIVGDVDVRALPPGNYILSRLVFAAATGCNGPNPIAHFSIPFTVKAGQATYLGALRYEPLTWSNWVGSTCSEGGYFVVTDEKARDIAIAKAKLASLPDVVVSNVPDTTALKLPLFQSAKIAAPQPSPTGFHIRLLMIDTNSELSKDEPKAITQIHEALNSGDLWQSDIALAHAWLGEIALKHHDLKTGVDELTESIRLDPGGHISWGDRGQAREQLKDFDGAFQDLTMAAHLAPRFFRWQLDLGDVEMKRHHTDLAMLHYDDVISLFPRGWEAYMHRAAANLELGRYDAAIADIDRGIAADAIEPAMGKSWQCQYGTKSGHAADVLVACDIAVAKYPKNESVLSIRGFARLDAGKADDARTDFDAALAIKPDLAMALYGRALASQKLGDAAAAQSDFNAARKLDPLIGDKARNLGVPAMEPAQPPA